MDNAVTKDLSEPNYATNILYGLIFQKGSLPLLKKAGLQAVYLDDYGCKKKYVDCIFFHFRHPLEQLLYQNKHGIVAAGLLNSITDFKSFYDYYELGGGMMIIFKYNPTFRQDIVYFKKGNFSQFSDSFKELAYSEELKDTHVDLSKEIYRY